MTRISTPPRASLAQRRLVIEQGVEEVRGVTGLGLIHSVPTADGKSDARLGSTFWGVVLGCGPGGSGPGGSSPAEHPATDGRGACGPDRVVLGALCVSDGASVDPARDVAAGHASASVRLDPLGAAADGAAGVRPVVPQVRRAGHRRSGLQSFELRPEPGPASGRRDRGPVPGRRAGSTPREAAPVQRSRQRRRHADRGLGVYEELQAQGSGRHRSRGRPAALAFDRNGHDAMDPVCGSGSAELQVDGSLRGEIRVHRGDEIFFIARRWPASSSLPGPADDPWLGLPYRRPAIRHTARRRRTVV